MVLVTRLALSLGLIWSPMTTAKAADFTLVNSSGVTLDQLYIVPCWGAHWGTNQFIGYPIVHSRSYTVAELAPGCYDLMVILPFGNPCTIAGANIRDHMTWVITRTTLRQATLNACSSTEHFVSVGGRPWIP